MDIKEVEEIIIKLNDEIFEQTGEESFYFEVCSIGHEMAVKFLGDILWNSEDDYREYVNENTPEEDYEPLEDFLRREANMKLDDLRRIKL